MLGKVGDAGLDFAQGFAGVVDEAGLFDEIIHAQRAAEPRGAAGGQRVVGAGKVIAQGLRHVFAQEDAARVLDIVEHCKRIIHADLQMLGRDDVHGVDGFLHVVGDDDLTVGVHTGACDGGAGQLRDLHFQLGLHGFGKLPAVGDKHRRGKLVVFGLAEQVGRDPGGVAAAVGQYQNFRRSCDHINADFAKHLALGGGNVDIAGADDLVHGGYALGAVGQRGHGLRAARLKDAVDACNDRRRQDPGVDLAVPARRGGHDDLLHARDLGGDNVHQHGGRVRCRAAGHVDARALDGGVLLAQHHAGAVVQHKIFVQLLLVEVADIGRCHFQRRNKFGVGGLQRGKGLVDLGLRDLHAVQLGMVELGSIVQQSGVAPGAHIGNDGVDGGFHVGFGADVAVQNLFGPYFVKIIQADHYARASFILVSSSVSWAYLNL